MGKRKKGKIHIGTSGFHYKHWVGRFYPQGMKPEKFLPYYFKFFHTVELNNPFYRLPSRETFDKWRQGVPEDFIFSVKASRYITHIKKLKEPEESVFNFIEKADGLKEKLGPILFQLPPGWALNEERLISFIKILPPHYRYTFEFRNPTWYNEKVYHALKQKNIAFCIYELEYHLSPVITTADFVYIRLHGPETKYAGSYSENSLSEWADRCREWSEEGKDVYLYFDNDQLGYAAFNAMTLAEMLQKEEVMQK
jgi:uncharacterized protein YecE (DUF72 family)